MMSYTLPRHLWDTTDSSFSDKLSELNEEIITLLQFQFPFHGYKLPSKAATLPIHPSEVVVRLEAGMFWSGVRGM